jgi:hypothetical protein
MARVKKGGGKARRQSASPRSRGARPPEFGQTFSHVACLFTPEDVVRFAAKAAAEDRKLKLRSLTEEEEWRLAHDLHQGLVWAMECGERQRLAAEPSREADWYRSVARASRALLHTLGLDSDERGGGSQGSVGLTMIRLYIDRCAGARPQLPHHLDLLSTMTWDDAGIRTEGDDVDERGQYRYRARTSFLIDRLPQTLTFLAGIAEWQSEKGESSSTRRRGKRPDRFTTELFKFLVIVHEGIFGRGPSTRSKTGDAIGGSICWARMVVQHAADLIEKGAIGLPPSPNADTAPGTKPQQRYVHSGTALTGRYVERLRQIACLSDRSICDHLDGAWRRFQSAQALLAP